MPTLSDYTNVYPVALKVLLDKGYQVWIRGSESQVLYCAERDGWDFFADSPTALLGLVAIHEHKRPEQYREYWWHTSGPLPSELPTSPEREYVSRIVSDRDPRG